MANAHSEARALFSPSTVLNAIDLAPGAVISVQGRKSSVTVIEVVDLYSVICEDSRGKRLELLESHDSWFRVAARGSHVPYRPISQPTVLNATESMQRL